MPGTPAAKKKEKKKEKEKKEPTGRQCVLTIVDHATRFCAIRILKSEKAEFTKGLERSWVKGGTLVAWCGEEAPGDQTGATTRRRSRRLQAMCRAPSTS